jgi:hypothetical protein
MPKYPVEEAMLITHVAIRKVLFMRRAKGYRKKPSDLYGRMQQRSILRLFATSVQRNDLAVLSHSFNRCTATLIR